MKVFYNIKQSVSANESFSPSAGKPRLVLEAWRALELPLEVSSFAPATIADLSLAHSQDYVLGVLLGRQANGFGNTSEAIADSLPWTTGSFVAAAQHAAETGNPAASLTSGFHHAGYDHGGGFCTFNGLMVAAQVLKKEGLVKKVGILDLDAHYGNGTNDIIRERKLGYIEHYTFGAEGIRPGNADQWIKDLPGIILNTFKDCDVLLFQAGADPHINDPLGGSLSTEQMRKRDQIVFETCRKMNLPIAWNLAGGYQTPIERVLEIHNNTAIQCVIAYEETKKEAA